MQLQAHPYSALLALTAFVSAAIVVVTWRRRTAPGALPLGVLMLALMIWSGTYAIHWASVTLRAQVFWLNATYFGVLAVPITFLLFVSRVSHNDIWIKPSSIALLMIEPIIIFLVVWTNDYHHLFHSSLEQIQVGPYSVLDWGRGLWFWINLGYSYLLILACLVMLFIKSLHANSLYKKQLGIILIGSIFPLAASAYTEFILSARSDLDLTPIFFSISGILFGYSLFRHGLLDFLPVARDAMIEIMSDGMLLLDSRNRIADINPAAQKLFNTDNSSAIGQFAHDLLPAWTEILLPYFDATEDVTITNVKFPEDEARYVDLSIAHLRNKKGHLTGRLFVFKETTEHIKGRNALQGANEALRTQLIEIHKLQEKLREQAVRDPLTDLFNRRYLIETLERELALAERQKTQVSLLMIDLDHLKKANDTYGHKCGDITLQTFASLLQSQARSSDVACRYGGDEFVLLLPNLSQKKAFQRAEQICRIYRKTDIHYGSFILRDTVSMGVATYPSHAKDGEELLRAADDALYVAKAKGGDQASLFDPATLRVHQNKDAF